MKKTKKCANCTNDILKKGKKKTVQGVKIIVCGQCGYYNAS